ncbi:unnamed protein product [Boreogadus saida]
MARLSTHSGLSQPWSSCTERPVLLGDGIPPRRYAHRAGLPHMVENAGNSTELRAILGGNANLKPPPNQTTTQPETTALETTPPETTSPEKRSWETTRETSHAGSGGSHAARWNAAPPKGHPRLQQRV